MASSVSARRSVVDPGLVILSTDTTMFCGFEVPATTARAFPGSLTVWMYLSSFLGVSKKVKRAGTLYDVS